MLLQTHEGLAALEDAQSFLEKQRPLSPLTLDPGLTAAAYLHSVYLSEINSLQHTGPDGSQLEARICVFGTYLQGSISENILNRKTYDPKSWILDFIIDDGVKSRGHRKNIFDKEAKQVGLGCYRAAEGSDYWFTMDFAGKGYRSDIKKIPQSVRYASGLTSFREQ